MMGCHNLEKQYKTKEISRFFCERNTATTSDIYKVVISNRLYEVSNNMSAIMTD